MPQGKSGLTISTYPKVVVGQKRPLLTNLGKQANWNPIKPYLSICALSDGSYYYDITTTKLLGEAETARRAGSERVSPAQQPVE